jgi:hypothetical protein
MVFANVMIIVIGMVVNVYQNQHTNNPVQALIIAYHYNSCIVIQHPKNVFAIPIQDFGIKQVVFRNELITSVVMKIQNAKAHSICIVYLEHVSIVNTLYNLFFLNKL